eukprot:g28013.t1
MSWCAGFNGDFWSGYREVIPEAPKYRQRAKLYEAYHIINHYNLFGGGYLQQGISLSSTQSTWLKRMDLEEVGMFEAYVASLHWSLTQFTPSTNNVAPANSLERLFAVFVILLAMGCFSSFVGSITATVNALRSIQATKVKQQNEVLRFFAERKMSLDLYRKTREGVFLAEVCHLAMQEEIARKSEDIFLPGTECHAAYLMEPGSAPRWRGMGSFSSLGDHQ